VPIDYMIVIPYSLIKGFDSCGAMGMWWTTEDSNVLWIRVDRP
jgi:hypothetical protein